MARRRTTGSRRGRSRNNSSIGTVLGVLIVVAIAVALAGAAAVVTVPSSLVVLGLVLAKPVGVGARIRQWGLWRRVRGLEPGRGRATFAVVLSLYGIVIPGACLSIIVAAALNSGTGQPAGSPVTDTSTPPGIAVALPTDTTAPTAAATDPPSVVPTPAPTPWPARALPADPCHSGGVTYCALNPAVTQATINRTICVSGWTATVRPPESYTYQLKVQQIAAEGLPGGTSNYEEDHRMPLELGGAPSAVANLSPESPPTPNPKDANESSLKYAVCDGSMTLVQAQAQMVATWLAAYPGYRR